MIRYKPTHQRIDLEKGWEIFVNLNPLQLPSGLIPEKTIKKIRGLCRKERSGYWWFQSLVDDQYSAKYLASPEMEDSVNHYPPQIKL